MDVKVLPSKKTTRRPRYLQALRDFTAADACFSDGANPLSFHIGEIFTFLSRRDNYWVNVERTIWKHNLLLKSKEHPAVERGIVPVDYVIEMDINTEQSEIITSAKSEADLVLCDVEKDDSFKRDTDGLADELKQVKRKLDDAYKENALLHERYYAVGEAVVTAKEELAIAQQSLIEEQERSQMYQKKLEDIKTQINKSGVKSAIKLLDKILQKDTKSQQNGLIQKGKSDTSCDDLMLSCALCHEKMRVADLASHSKVCCPKDTSKHPTTPSTPSPELLRVTVTSSETDEKNATFKVVTKCEFQEKFMCLMQSRTCQNTVCALLQVLKKHCLLNLFLTGEGQDLQKARDELEMKKQKDKSAVDEYMSQECCSDQNAPVIKCQRYLEQFAANLDGLITYLQESLNKCMIDGPGVWFKSLSDCEPSDTYLKTAAEALSKICMELENNRETAEEKLIVNDLKSVYHYVKSGEGLLQRVQAAVARFVHWEEEVRAYEEMKEPSLENESDASNQTQKWAEANSNCAEAKTKLEHLCKELSSELAHFDWRKEVELREILIEYSALKSEHFEKVQSKWFGVKLMVEAPVAAEARAIKCVEDT
ncbi:PREDICTED: uncharacterized protein LOC107355000 [Acropora digitifera]|uniref:uncharacterized protein LOC107355000 n=1 Tax=Acropora digitifera TaxID=70779 RepID=UPI00077A1898|nr:PREDICTED: uncharacterized protein LOC107355000 [Acropora digitifera]